jgi:adenylate cyclase
MKRCPQCNRIETDEALKFCRVDGATLVSESSGLASEAGTGQPGSSLDASEVHTSILPHSTQANVNRATGPTTNLPQSSTGPTYELSQPRPRKAVLIAIAAVVIIGIGIIGLFIARRFSTSSSAPKIESVAVLPFENKSGNADSEYLSDGLAESLIYRLSQLPNLKVSSTSSVIRYKGNSDVAQIAKELEVDAVMSGRVTQRGEDLTVNVELVDARTRKIIWAEQYARKMSDLLATQREIATAVTQKLQLKLSGNEAGLTKQYTNNNEAYQLYLKGRFYWNKRTSAGMKTAIDHFKAASEKDPNFALAYVGLADSYLVGLYNTRGQEKEDIPMAKAYASRALEIDSSLAEVHATLGLVNHYLWNWADAEKYFKRSIELNPNYPSARHWYSRSLRNQGRYDEAFAQIMQAQQLDSLSLAISNNVAESLLQQGDVAGAIKESQRTLEIGDSWPTYRNLAHCYLRLGQKEEAVANARKAAELLNGSPVALKVLGYVQASVGNRTEALAIARQIENEFAKGNADGRDVAIVYAGLKENDKVFEWLDKDFQSRNSSLAELRLEVPFIPLRTDPRFKDLLKRMGLPE